MTVPCIKEKHTITEGVGVGVGEAVSMGRQLLTVQHSTFILTPPPIQTGNTYTLYRPDPRDILVLKWPSFQYSSLFPNVLSFSYHSDPFPIRIRHHEKCSSKFALKRSAQPLHFAYCRSLPCSHESPLGPRKSRAATITFPDDTSLCDNNISLPSKSDVGIAIISN